MPEAQQLFDRRRYRARREATAARFSRHDVIHREAEARLLERLDTVDRIFDTALILGAPTTQLGAHPRIKQALFADLAYGRLPAQASHASHASHASVLDEEWLPIAPKSLALIVSCLTLHHINDIPGTLIQMRHALQDDGLLLVMQPGALSLWELRDAFSKAESAQGGLTPRIAPFTDVRDAGGLLQRADFSLPVIDSEVLTLSYATPFDLMAELRGLGETNILHERQHWPTRRQIFMDAAAIYQRDYSDAEGRISCTVELQCLTAWTPHPSQQRPKERGSGEVHFSELFGDPMDHA